MYSTEKNPGVNWKDIIIRLVFLIVFILLLIWLFAKKTPNMSAFYSNVFRENISYMQDAARSYYTTDKLPKNIGDVSEMTLQEMIEKKLILPFVDKDGNSCDTKESYVQVTKGENEYVLKVNLVCDDEAAYIVETLGCYEYCESGECECDCEVEEEKEEIKTKQVTEYQFKQAYTKNISSKSCLSGYTLGSDGKCHKITNSNPVPAEQKYKLEKIALEVIKTKVSNKETYDCSTTSTEQQCHTEYVKETYNCPKTGYKEVCTTKNVTESYDCNCSTKIVNGVPSYSCNTCYRTVPKQSCSTQSYTYTGTCTKDVPKTVCEDITVTNKKTCEKYTDGYKYECPKEATDKTGSESSLQCFKYENVKDGLPKCPTDKKYTQIGNLCYFATDDVKNPTVTTKKVTEYKYKWSTSKTLKGWTATGKTRTKTVTV